MLDPVTDDYGTYEREALLDHYKKTHIHPITRKPSANKNPPRNQKLRNDIELWLDQNPQCSDTEFLNLMLNATICDVDTVLRKIRIGTTKNVQLRFQFKDDGTNLSGTVLHWATKMGCEKLVEACLIKGAPVDEKLVPMRVTALGIAASMNHVKMVKMLLEHKANPNIKFDHGVTAIMGACSVGNLDMLRLFAENGADVHATDENGVSVLHRAVKSGVESLVTVLLFYNVDINVADHEGWTPIFHAIWSENPSMFRYLVRRNANLNLRTTRGETILHICCELERPDMLKSVLQHYTHVDETDDKGRTALVHAVLNDRAEHVEILLDYNAFVNFPDNEGNTPLHYASMYRHKHIVKTLVRYDADIFALNKLMRTPLDLADEKIASILLRWRTARVSEQAPAHIVDLERTISQQQVQQYTMSEALARQQEQIKELQDQNEKLTKLVEMLLKR
jgi:hypothetical protein